MFTYALCTFTMHIAYITLFILRNRAQSVGNFDFFFFNPGPVSITHRAINEIDSPKYKDTNVFFQF